MAKENDSLLPLFFIILVLVVIGGFAYIFVAFGNQDYGHQRIPQQSTPYYMPAPMISQQIVETPSDYEQVYRERNELRNRVDDLERQQSQYQSSLDMCRTQSYNNYYSDYYYHHDHHHGNCEDDLNDAENRVDDLRDKIDELCNELDDHDINSDEC